MKNIEKYSILFLVLMIYSCNDLSKNNELQQCMIEKEELATAFHQIKNENSSGSEKIIALIRSISDIQNRMTKSIVENNVKIIEIASFEHKSNNRVSGINKMMNAIDQSLKKAKSELYQKKREIQNLRILNKTEKEELFNIIYEKENEIKEQKIKIHDLQEKLLRYKVENKKLVNEVEKLEQKNRQLTEKKFVLLISKRGKVEREIRKENNNITFNFKLKDKNIFNELNPRSYRLHKSQRSTITIINWDLFWQDSPFLIIKGNSNGDTFWY